MFGRKKKLNKTLTPKDGDYRIVVREQANHDCTGSIFYYKIQKFYRDYYEYQPKAWLEIISGGLIKTEDSPVFHSTEEAFAAAEKALALIKCREEINNRPPEIHYV